MEKQKETTSRSRRTNRVLGLAAIVVVGYVVLRLAAFLIPENCEIRSVYDVNGELVKRVEACE